MPMQEIPEDIIIDFPIFKSVYPQLIAKDLVSVQPMQNPCGEVFIKNIRFREITLEEIEIIRTMMNHPPVYLKEFINENRY